MTKPSVFLVLISLLSACSVFKPTGSLTAEEDALAPPIWSIPALDTSLMSETDVRGELWVTKHNDEGRFFIRVDKSILIPASPQEEWVVVPVVKAQSGSGQFYELYLFRHRVTSGEWEFQSALPLGDRIHLKEVLQVGDSLVCLQYLDYAPEQSFAEVPRELKTDCAMIDESQLTLNRVRHRNEQGVVTLLEKPLPISSGRYTFTFLASEERKTFVLSDVDINRQAQTLTSRDSYALGLLMTGNGELLFHTLTQQWILVERDSDEQAEDVGGCAGPVVVDFEHQVLKGC